MKNRVNFKSKLARTWRLALSYLAIIMTLSLFFSWILFSVFSSQLQKPLSPAEHNFSQTFSESTDSQFRARRLEAEDAIFSSLVILNLFMLVNGAWMSYALARWTLHPIEEVMEQQQRFISDASHEIKTPLAALLATNEVAFRKKSLDETKMRQILEKNINEVRKLRQLTDDLLQVSHSNELNLEKNAFELKQLLDDIIEIHQPLASAKKIRIINDVKSQSVTSFETGVGQIFKILLDNAIKYSPEDSEIVIKFKNGVLSVRDHGIGIAKSEQGKIFERFYRSDKARTRSENSGHGLGLSIAKSIADKSNFKLEVVSEQGKGAEFRLRI